MKLSREEIAEIAHEFGIDENELTEFVSSRSEGGKKGPWPMRLKWCQEDQEVQDLFKKYKYLAPLLNELKLFTAIHKDRNFSVGVDSYEQYGTEKEYVLLDLSKSRERIANDIGCSVETVGNYIRGLVDCGLMVTFPKGRKTYYSMGEWGIMQSEQDPSEIVPRKIMWLTQATSGKLKRFKPYRR